MPYFFIFVMLQVLNTFILPSICKSCIRPWEALSLKFILSQPYIRWRRMKKFSQTNFLSPWYNIFLTVTENKFLVWNYRFSGPTSIYLVKFSNNNSRIKCKICSKLTVEAPDIVLVSLLLTLITFYVLFECYFFYWLWTCKCQPDGILYCLNLNFSMCFSFMCIHLFSLGSF